MVFLSQPFKGCPGLTFGVDVLPLVLADQAEGRGVACSSVLDSAGGADVVGHGGFPQKELVTLSATGLGNLSGTNSIGFDFQTWIIHRK